MKNLKIEYDYIVHHIAEGKSTGYKAIIPAFNGVVFGDNLAELEVGVALAIEEELKVKKVKPDAGQLFSGKFMVRIKPAMHERLALAAKARGQSLNAFVQEKMRSV